MDPQQSAQIDPRCMRAYTSPRVIFYDKARKRWMTGGTSFDTCRGDEIEAKIVLRREASKNLSVSG